MQVMGIHTLQAWETTQRRQRKSAAQQDNNMIPQTGSDKMHVTDQYIISPFGVGVAFDDKWSNNTDQRHSTPPRCATVF